MAKDDSQSTDSGSNGGNGMTPTQKKAMFEAYEQSTEDYNEATDAAEKAKKARSDKVKEIATRLGNGPFRWRGQTLTITRRGGEDGLYFFTQKREADEIG